MVKNAEERDTATVVATNRKAQIARIKRMEDILDKSSRAVQDLKQALDRYAALTEDIRELEQYYTDGQWQKDYADDEAGRLPKDLKRGVLSEDAVYDFLAFRDEMLARMKRNS